MKAVPCYRHACGLALVCLLTSPLTMAKEKLQGTYFSGAHVRGIHQVGDRVCGEWDFATQSSNREGLVAGTVADGVLTLTECSDFRLTCRPARVQSNPSLMRFIQKGTNLERLGRDGNGSNEVFVRLSRLQPNGQIHRQTKHNRSCPNAVGRITFQPLGASQI